MVLMEGCVGHIQCSACYVPVAHDRACLSE